MRKRWLLKKAIILSIAGNKKSCSNIVTVELDKTIPKSMPMMDDDDGLY